MFSSGKNMKILVSRSGDVQLVTEGKISRGYVIIQILKPQKYGYRWRDPQRHISEVKENLKSIVVNENSGRNHALADAPVGPSKIHMFPLLISDLDVLGKDFLRQSHPDISSRVTKFDDFVLGKGRFPWSSSLKAVGGGYPWLLEDSPLANENLREKSRDSKSVGE
ncbi:hypothetical protein AMTR_s00009p00164870 [Amborella trichopoda]|uniref:Uncharacterized protein n=1 Tax=Amborella trichopoda TaxID=13333 RepID=W1NGI7_AMBTC|nr:hypothetical protein AMTR_s00009p00164870 [Amborella trichopoda]